MKNYKGIKKLWPVVICLALALAALTGCGQQQEGSPEAVIQEAMDKLDDLDSARYTMTMDMDMSAAEQSLQSTTVAEISSIMEPMTMAMDMKVDMGEMGDMNMKMYMEEQDGAYISYTSIDDGASWSKEEVADADTVEQYDAVSNLDIYLSSSSEFTEKGEEEINGSMAVRYEGIIAKEDIARVMDASGMAEQMTQFGLSEEDAADLYADLDNVGMVVWIDKTSGYPIKYEMDMTAVMQQLMNNLMSSMGEAAADTEISVNKMVIAIEMYDFNAVDSIEIPAAAKNAE